MGKDKVIELEEHRAMLYLPENAVEVFVHAKVYIDGEIVDVAAKYSMPEIREAFRKADDGYIDEDDRFVLTEEGERWFEEHKDLIQ